MRERRNRQNDVDFAANQLGSQLGQRFEPTARSSNLKRDVSALDVALLPERLAEGLKAPL